MISICKVKLTERCKMCDGAGMVVESHYNELRSTMESTNTVCRTCMGSGQCIEVCNGEVKTFDSNPVYFRAACLKCGRKYVQQKRRVRGRAA